MNARNVENFVFIIAIKDVSYEVFYEIFTLPDEQIEINEHCFVLPGKCAAFQILYYLIYQCDVVYSFIFRSVYFTLLFFSFADNDRVCCCCCSCWFFSVLASGHRLRRCELIAATLRSALVCPRPTRSFRVCKYEYAAN